MATAITYRPLHLRNNPNPAWTSTILHLWRSCKAAVETVDELKETQKTLHGAAKMDVGWLLDRAYDELEAIERYAQPIVSEWERRQ